MNTDFNKLIQKSIPFAFIILIAYIISTAIFVYLPKSGVDFEEESNSTLEYKKYNGFYSQVKVQQKVKTPKKVLQKKKAQSLSDYLLKGIYSTSSNGGWIIIENNKKNKSQILSQYEEIDGYILTKLYKSYVVFEKSAKEYRLDMKAKNTKIKYEVTQKVEGINERIEVSGDDVKIKREYLNSYVKDIDKVWNNIAINEIRQNGKIDGFKVSKVNKNSVFGKLGLKQGDIIKAINNNVLGSYADAFKVYNNINNTKYLNIEILRNNEIMELNYEID